MSAWRQIHTLSHNFRQRMQSAGSFTNSVIFMNKTCVAAATAYQMSHPLVKVRCPFLPPSVKKKVSGERVVPH